MRQAEDTDVRTGDRGDAKASRRARQAIGKKIDSTAKEISLAARYVIPEALTSLPSLLSRHALGPDWAIVILLGAALVGALAIAYFSSRFDKRVRKQRRPEGVTPETAGELWRSLERQIEVGPSDEVPVLIYLSSYEDHAQLERRLDEAVERLGYEVTFRARPRRGSWLGGRILRKRATRNSRTASREASGVEKAREAKVLAETAAVLLKSIDGDGVVYTGASVAIKDGSRTLYMILTLAQRECISNNPQLLFDPKGLLRYLAGSPLMSPVSDDEDGGKVRELDQPGGAF